MPFVTVLMSCYNGERWVCQAIDSVLRQTFTDFEFVIVDDGSTDGSQKIIDACAELDPRVTVVRKPNSGLADSLNVGIRRARGEWIARLDADDICEPERLERQLELARLIPHCVFVGSGLTEIDEDGNPLAVFNYPRGHAELVANLSMLRKFPPHSSAFFRTATTRALGGYRTRLKRSQDSDLWLRLSELGQLTAIDAPLVRIRKHSKQISHDNAGRRQRVDARVAVISYWIRQAGGVDPVADSDEAFHRFRVWLEKRMEALRMFDYLQFVVQTKNLVADCRRSPAAVHRLVRHIVGSPELSLRFLRVRLFGESLPRRLAREWLQTRSMGHES